MSDISKRNEKCFSSLFFIWLDGPLLVCSGLGLFVHMMYLGESSPTKLRGMVTLTSATFFAIGKLSGQLAGLKYSLIHIQ